VSECNREASTVKKPWTTTNYSAIGGGGGELMFKTKGKTKYVNLGILYS